MSNHADDLEAAIKAIRPNATLLPHPTANAPDHRWIDVAWGRFMITVLAPVTPAGIVKGYMLYTHEVTPEVFTDVAPLLERIKAVVPE